MWRMNTSSVWCTMASEQRIRDIWFLDLTKVFGGSTERWIIPCQGMNVKGWSVLCGGEKESVRFGVRQSGGSKIFYPLGEWRGMQKRTGMSGVLVAWGWYLVAVQTEKGNVSLRMFSSRSWVQRGCLVEQLMNVLMGGISDQEEN